MNGMGIRTYAKKMGAKKPLRLKPREYTLKATGWVRVVSEVQSLISIYLPSGHLPN